MASRGKSLNPGYKPGSHWANCWSCGFAFRAEKLKKTWDNRWVCDEDFEPRHPQDFIRVKAERTGVDGPILEDDTTNEVAVTFAAQEGTVPTATF